MGPDDPAFVGRARWRLGTPGSGALFEDWPFGPRIVVDLDKETREQQAAFAKVQAAAAAEEGRKARRKALRDAKKGKV